MKLTRKDAERMLGELLYPAAVAFVTGSSKPEDDKHPAILSGPRSTTIRPGEKPSDAVRRLGQGDDL